jgi:TatD DNase family protein
MASARRVDGGAVDTHCHLFLLSEDPASAVEDARRAGVGTLVTVGIDPESSRRCIEFAESFRGVFATVGMHPHTARDFDTAAGGALEELSSNPQVVGVGECGLDFYRDLSPRAKQVEAFGAHLQLAQRLDLPVVVHSREATPQTFDVLARHPLPASGVMHCFDGTAADAARALRLGMFISCAGPLTYRRDPTLANAIASVPDDRLVIETDCPWLSPAGHRGERNEPAYVRLVAEAVARVRGRPVAEMAQQTARNAAHLFRTPALAGAALEVLA